MPDTMRARCRAKALSRAADGAYRRQLALSAGDRSGGGRTRGDSSGDFLVLVLDKP